MNILTDMVYTPINVDLQISDRVFLTHKPPAKLKMTVTMIIVT